MSDQATVGADDSEVSVPETSAPLTTLMFIRDEPADEDFFSTHTALAQAISRTIVTNPKVRTIGLLGRWGSGKSTVLRQLDRELPKLAPDRHLIFTYDAWLHQHDPVRRSFIEELVAFSMARGITQSQDLEEQIKELLGQVRKSDEEITPRLTPDAKSLLLSLLPVPLGLALLSLDVIKGTFGSDVSRAAQATFVCAGLLIITPAVVWFLRYIGRRPWSEVGIPFKRKHQAKLGTFFRIVDPEGRPSAVIPALINQSIKRTSTRTISLPEPTTIEFGKVFRSIVELLSGTSSRRLVIVIDNLDRVPEEEALQIWATIRSFFAAPLTASGDEDAYDPLVLLPIDRGAIERMFARSHGKEDAKELAESFVHKTFEVTFEVTQPVMSDWREFLAMQMKEAFSTTLSENWIFWTRKFFERKQQEKKSSPTPRQINRLVNRLLASFMQWGDESVKFPVQAFYAVFQEKIESNFSEFITSNQPDLTKISTRWQEQIAALYYGVKVNKAIQTLLDRPMTAAVQNGNMEDIKSFIEVPGFDDSLELISSDLSTVEIEDGNGIALVRNMVSLMGLLERPASEATEQIWTNIASYYCGKGEVWLAAPGSAAALQQLTFHIPQALTEQFLRITTAAISKGLQGDVAANQAELRRVGLVVIEFCERAGLNPPDFHIGDNGPRVILRIAQANETPKLLQRYWSDISERNLDEAFAAAVRDPLQASIAERAFGAILAETEEEQFTEIGDTRRMAWTETLSACSEAIREGIDGSRANPAMDILVAAMPHVEGAKSIVRSAGQEGILSSRLNETVAAGDDGMIARYAAALIWSDVDFAINQPWADVLKQHPGLPKQITTSLREMHGPSTISVIWKAHDTAKGSRDLIRSLVEFGIIHNELGSLNPQSVMSNLGYYLRPVPYFQVDRFIDRISNYTSFWERMSNVDLTHNFQRAAKSLGKDKAKRVRIEEIVKAKIDNLTSDQWFDLIVSGKEPLPVVIEVFSGTSLGFAKNSPLYKALERSIPSIFSDRSTRPRWVALNTLLKESSSKSLMNEIAKVTLKGQSASNTLGVLKALDDAILSSPVWLKDADASVREIVLKQAGSKPGRAWLKKHSARMKSWITRSSGETRATLGSLLDTMTARGAEERRYWAEVCKRDWKL